MKVKYTNPANPVRDFCKQKFRPLPALFWPTEASTDFLWTDFSWTDFFRLKEHWKDTEPVQTLKGPPLEMPNSVFA